MQAGGDSWLAQAISLAYPAGDTVVITIVIYTWLRARHSRQRLPVSLPLVGTGLVAFAVADSGFVYLTTSGAYSSGSLIDIGWFLGFALMLLAALRRGAGRRQARQADATDSAVSSARSCPMRPSRRRCSPRSSRSCATGVPTLRVLEPHRPDRVPRRPADPHAPRELGADPTLEQRVEARTAELHASRQRFAALVQHSSDVVTVVDGDGVIIYQSESCLRVLGRTAESMTGPVGLGLHVADQAPAAQGRSRLGVAGAPCACRQCRTSGAAATAASATSR